MSAAALRRDPAFRLGLGRGPQSGLELCSQPTINRFENASDEVALREMFRFLIDFYRERKERGVLNDEAHRPRPTSTLNQKQEKINASITVPIGVNVQE